VRTDSPAARAHLLATGRTAGGATATDGGTTPAAVATGSVASPTTPADGTPIPASILAAFRQGSRPGVTWTAVPTDPVRHNDAAESAHVNGSPDEEAVSGPDAIGSPGAHAASSDSSYEDDDDEDDDPMLVRSGRRRWPVVSVALLVLVAVVGAGSIYGWRLTQDEYFVGTADGKVVVFRGVNQAVAGFKLSTMVQRTDIPITAVPSVEAGQIQATIPAESLKAAYRIVSQIRHDYKCAVVQADIRRWFADRARTTAKSKTTVAHKTTGKNARKAPRFGRTTAKRMSGSPKPSPSSHATGRPAAKPAASATRHPTPSGTHSAAPKNTGTQQSKPPVSSQPKPQLPPFCPAGGAAG
jgi:hypothetical protein